MPQHCEIICDYKTQFSNFLSLSHLGKNQKHFSTKFTEALLEQETFKGMC